MTCTCRRYAASEKAPWAVLQVAQWIAKHVENSGKIRPTLPFFLQGSAPLSERLSLTVQVVFLAVPEIVTVNDVVSLPQTTGSKLAATQLHVRALRHFVCLRARLASLGSEGGHTIWPIGWVRAVLGLRVAECLGRQGCQLGS